MMEDRACTALARLLVYPDGEFLGRLDEAIGVVRRESPEAADQLASLAEAMGPLSPEDHEELFMRTFDVKPATALEIGWHLFGEDYHRGALMVRLRSELRRHGVEESSELPDHLTHVLALLDRMSAEEAEAFASACVMPAVEKILEGFREQDNPYEDLLRAVAAVVRIRQERSRSQALPGNGLPRGSASSSVERDSNGRRPHASEIATVPTHCVAMQQDGDGESKREDAKRLADCVPTQSVGTMKEAER
ncbi:MAG: molecular chaperone TorD family protein [Pirellulales bacterium]|nr:molecular chaperone TorD family protein [Pirellulales bacterium]